MWLLSLRTRTRPAPPRAPCGRQQRGSRVVRPPAAPRPSRNRVPSSAAPDGAPSPPPLPSPPSTPCHPPPKLLWVQPTTIAAVGAALEAGVGVLVFDERDPGAPPPVPRAAAARVGRFDALALRPGGAIVDAAGAPCGAVVTVRGPADVDAAAARAVDADAATAAGVVVDPAGWAVIPAENLVAAWQGARRAGARPPPSSCGPTPPTRR